MTWSRTTDELNRTPQTNPVVSSVYWRPRHSFRFFRDTDGSRSGGGFGRRHEVKEEFLVVCKINSILHRCQRFIFISYNNTDCKNNVTAVGLGGTRLCN